MLSEIKHSFINCANIIPDWRTESIQQLSNNYIQYEKTDPILKDAYFAALMCRYWSAIDKYYMQSQPVASAEDCFEWLTHALLYALEHRKWLDPTSNIYDDPNGADKVINRCIKSTRLIFYDNSNKDKRKIQAVTFSLNELCEQNGDSSFPTDYIENSPDINIGKELIKDAFIKRNYFDCFMIDGIINADTTDYYIENYNRYNVYSIFSIKKLVKHLKQLDDSYCNLISRRFNLDNKIMATNAKEIRQLSSQRLYTKIKNRLEALKSNSLIKSCIPR